jgi:hypothetical protein
LSKTYQIVCLLIIILFLTVDVVNAFVYETKTHTLSQTILRNWFSDWNKRIRITIDHNDISSDLSNFPVLVHLSSSSGINNSNLASVFNEVGANSKKIAITTSNSTQCYVEIEKWIYPLATSSQVLSPNAPGDTTTISSVYPGGTPHWQTVDEEVANNDADYVYTSSTSFKTDLFNLPDYSGSGTINSITLNFCFRVGSSYNTASACATIKTNGVTYTGSVMTSTSTSYDTRYYTWSNNPNTGLPWTWSDLAALQIGVGLKSSSSFVNAICTQVYLEINYTPLGGEAWLWTKVPNISSTVDTRLYIYYDNNHVDNTDYVGNIGSSAGKNVWDSNYKGVWHLIENPSGIAPQMKDSTSNANHGTSYGSMTSNNQINAEVDGGLDFDGSNDEINCGNGASLLINTALTIEAWAKTSSTGTIKGIVNKQVDGSYNGYQLRMYSDNKYRFAVGNPASYYAASNTAYTDGNWHYVVGVKGTINYLFVDGLQQTSTFTQPITDSNANFDIGRSYSSYNGYWWPDGIDEVRVSNLARSSGWIKASYETEIDNLIYFSDEQIR